MCTIHQLFCFSVHADDFIHHVESGLYAVGTDAATMDFTAICAV